VNAKTKPLLCYITDRQQLPAGQTLQTAISAALAAEAAWIQIREKDLPPRDLLGIVSDAVQRCAHTSARVIVNDRLDVALAAGAQGVHLGRESLAVGEVQRWLSSQHVGKGFLVGVSCHSVDEVQEAGRAQASYAIFGPVFDTPSKRQFGPAVGLPALRDACRSVQIPVLAIGGITLANLPDCVAAGAAGIAAIRMFQATASSS